MSDDIKLYESAGFGFLKCKTCHVVIGDTYLGRKSHEVRNKTHKLATKTQQLQTQKEKDDKH